jgi:hypothetical protein
VSLPRKGSRRIEVAGREFIWLIRKKPTYAQGVAAGPMTVAVQSAEGRSVLTVDLKVSRPDNWISSHQTQVTPEMVREMVRAAMKGGWVPASDEGFRLSYPLIKDR